DCSTAVSDSVLGRLVVLGSPPAPTETYTLSLHDALPISLANRASACKAGSWLDRLVPHFRVSNFHFQSSIFEITSCRSAIPSEIPARRPRPPETSLAGMGYPCICAVRS